MKPTFNRRNRMVRDSRRNEFLAMMSKEAMKPYECPGEEWNEDEKEFLPIFVKLIGSNKLILDLAGGYGRITPYLMKNNNNVILADLSLHCLRLAKKTIRNSNLHIVCMDVLHLPFIDNVFEAAWFTQAFEYVPPEKREDFLGALKRTIKGSGFVFLNVAKVPNECSRFSYLKNYIYWKLLRRQPVIWGDYIYKIYSKHYSGWHYHSIVFTRRIDNVFKKINFEILKFKDGKNGYLTYLLQAN
jgi:ubiquinone/menaquinone biosynthesis C-methylase UbiE